MIGRDFLKQMLTSIFVVVTLVTIAIGVLGNIFRPGQQFGYEAVFAPVLYGLLSMKKYGNAHIGHSRLMLCNIILLIKKVLINFPRGNGVFHP